MSNQVKPRGDDLLGPLVPVRWLILGAGVLALVVLPSCNRNSDPVAKKPDNAPKAEPPEQKAIVKPKEKARQPPPDPLIEKAKALSAGKVRIELIRSHPAGTAGERAEYEWAILTQFPTKSDKLPKDGKKEVLELKSPKWVVSRMMLMAAVEKSLEKDSKDRRFINLHLSCSSIWDAGNSNMGGQLLTTKNLSLGFHPSGVFPALLLGEYAFGKGGKQHALAAKKAPLDELIIPLAKEPKMIDLPFTLELARFGDETIAVELMAIDTK
jgi:hypothetical protein